MKQEKLKTKWHLLFIALTFTFMFIIITKDSIQYHLIQDVSIAFALISKILLFTIFNTISVIILLVKRCYKQLAILLGLLLLIYSNVTLGFAISFAVTPIISGIGAYHYFKLFVKINN
jgi:hypothetical protein